MKTIGLIGGMSWESTASYYRLINEGVKARLGGFHSAKILLYSVDFAEIEALQTAGDWDTTADILSQAAVSVENGGADCLLICTNTMHKVAPVVAQAISIPLLHIADATGSIISEKKMKTVGLLGTSFTMEQTFYKKRLAEMFGLNVLIPEKFDRNLVHNVIYNELCLGKVNTASRDEYTRIIGDLVKKGAECIILGCTEIGLLVDQNASPVPLLDTTEIHANRAVDFALEPTLT